MKSAAVLLVLALTGCSTTVAIVDTAAAATIYTAKTAVGVTYDATVWTGKKIVGSNENKDN